MDHNMYIDSIGRTFCAKHRRASCHDCRYDFSLMNDMAEIKAGLRRPPTHAEKLAEEKVTLQRAIDFMMQQDPRTRAKMKENLDFHKRELKRVEKEIEKLRSKGKESEVQVAMQKNLDIARTQDAERKAVVSAMAKKNPGQTSFEIGGPGTQELYDTVAAGPPSANRDQSVDPYTCSYCQTTSVKKLPNCARCKKQAYCSKDCQKKHWKAHKLECVPVDKLSKEDRKKLPLSWEQLETFGVAEGKKLEVRFIEQEPGLRLVAQCKDRVGICKRVAAYTDSRQIPGFTPGKVMEWKHPRFHYFMDGTSGARIEEADLPNIKIKD